jgi:glycosyltransferase involved in cell wall biosynthesis
MEPLVSILIPAYNAATTIAETLQSAIDQTWQRKEIIVIDDGSTDQTLAMARRFESASVRVVSQAKLGAAAARNQAFRVSKGDYIQWLDADDLLAPRKVERQLAAVHAGDSCRVLLSSSWGTFYYRPDRALFTETLLWRDLSPVDWLLTKMDRNLHMQTATWLMSRQLAEAVGPWDTRLLSDDDGEYFSRVLVASAGTRFVGGTGVYWRINGLQRLSYIGSSDKKKDALLLSMKLHIQYLRSLEDSERVRKACLNYLQNWLVVFYPERPDLVADLEALAVELHGRLEMPRLRAKYQWMRLLFGWKAAKWVQNTAPQLRALCFREWDKAMYRLETNKAA